MLSLKHLFENRCYYTHFLTRWRNKKSTRKKNVLSKLMCNFDLKNQYGNGIFMRKSSTKQFSRMIDTRTMRHLFKNILRKRIHARLVINKDAKQTNNLVIIITFKGSEIAKNCNNFF